MQIEFSPSALKDIKEIYSFLKIDNPKQAKHIIRKIKNSIQALAEFPHKCRHGIAPNTRELVIPHLPYSVPYEIYMDTIYVLRIYHSSRIPIKY